MQDLSRLKNHLRSIVIMSGDIQIAQHPLIRTHSALFIPQHVRKLYTPHVSGAVENV